jgi:hypothetical protein
MYFEKPVDLQPDTNRKLLNIMKWRGCLILSAMTAHVRCTPIKFEKTREGAWGGSEHQHIQETTHHNVLEKRFAFLVPLLASLAAPVLTSIVGKFFAPTKKEAPSPPPQMPESAPQPLQSRRYDDDEDDEDDDEGEDDDDDDENDNDDDNEEDY